jgi:hypothetical protein
MNRPPLTLVGSLILVIGLVGLASPAAADPRPSLRIALHVCDDPSIPPNLVSRGKAEMSRIYRDAGIDIVWTREAPATTGSDDPQSLASSDPQLTLIILSRELPDGLAVATTALGGAVGTREYRGRTAYIFYNRVERIARTYLNMSRRRGMDDIDNVMVLAHAMAHEIGHLLLPYGHSATGLMRADWDAQDMRLAVHGRLNFTSEQAELIRIRFLALLADTQSLNSK